MFHKHRPSKILPKHLYLSAKSIMVKHQSKIYVCSLAVNMFVKAMFARVNMYPMWFVEMEKCITRSRYSHNEFLTVKSYHLKLDWSSYQKDKVPIMLIKISFKKRSKFYPIIVIRSFYKYNTK